jgi:tetratricopeptide (TPR) repeat protein
MLPTKNQHQWTSRQALIFVTICLAVGIVGGWFIRGFQSAPQLTPAQAAVQPSMPPAAAPASPVVSQAPSPARLKEMADAQAAPLLTKLSSDPKNSQLLTSIANLYYDAQQYPTAVDYYGRVLQNKPSDVSVRTDMATAYWYLGNPDRAIEEFNKALIYAPNNPNTLFNLGIVKWQGKHDSAGAIADFKKLLATSPNYEQKDKVQQMLTDVEKQTASKPGARS